MSTPVLEKPSTITGVEDFAAADEIVHGRGCEVRHVQPKCSGDITYRVVDCVYQFNVCESFVTTPGNGYLARRERNVCFRCKRKAVDCWKHWPI